MNLNKMTKEELETLSFTDMAEMILKEQKALNTKTIFEQICKLLGYSDEDLEEKIGDFYTSLTTDKRFIFLENGNWDLRCNHSIKIELDDEDEDEIEEEIEPEEEVEETDEIDGEIIDDDIDDDIDELSIVSDEDLEEES